MSDLTPDLLPESLPSGGGAAVTARQVADLRREVRPSPCPGLFRVVPARDGGICRIKLARGRLTAGQALAVAQAARLYGNGVIEATNRSNLQLRGLSAGSENEAIAVVLSAGLGVSPAGRSGPGADDIRNVMISPTSGLCRQELVDMTPLADRLLARLEQEPRYHRLSPKFSILLDGGSACSPVEHRHDIWLSALPGDDGQMACAFGLAGHPPLLEGEGDPPLAMVPLADALTLLNAVLDLFCALAEEHPALRRFRHLPQVMEPAAFLEQLRDLSRLDLPAAPAGWRRAAVQPLSHVGVLPRLPSADGQERLMLGVAPPLGRLTPEMLQALANEALLSSGGLLRLTPWQSVLLPDVCPAAAPDAMARLQAAGLTCSAQEPLASMVACSGTPGCASALADSKADALELASLLRGSVSRVGSPFGSLHLTACAKSCASARSARTTLVAVDGGRYDLYRRQARGQRGFGVRLARAQTMPEVATFLQSLSRQGLSPSPETPSPETMPPESLPAVEPAAMLDYVRDAQDIYRRSFAIIRAEADLERIPPDLEKLAVRVAHACGMPDVVNDLMFSPGAGAAGRAALAAGAPVFCDCRMVADGITRARLPACNDILCTLNDPAVPALAREMGTTRSAAALELWRPRLAGSVVAIGNAPTALFRLLEMLDDGAPRPALIIGIPVGFVGAAESKDALAADSRGVPFVAVRGRRGGSAMTAAAINALATEQE